MEKYLVSLCFIFCGSMITAQPVKVNILIDTVLKPEQRKELVLSVESSKEILMPKETDITPYKMGFSFAEMILEVKADKTYKRLKYLGYADYPIFIMEPTLLKQSSLIIASQIPFGFNLISGNYRIKVIIYVSKYNPSLKDVHSKWYNFRVID